MTVIFSQNITTVCGSSDNCFNADTIETIICSIPTDSLNIIGNLFYPKTNYLFKINSHTAIGISSGCGE
jgi:hypothetical protein